MVNTRFKKGQVPWNKGKELHYSVWNKGLEGLPARHTTPHTEETKRKCSEAQKKRWAEGKYENKQMRHSEETKRKIGISRSRNVFITCVVCNKTFPSFESSKKRGRKYCSNKCNGLDKRGKNHHGWKNGITSNRIRQYTPEYKRWRRTILIRDEYMCQHCGTESISLHVHHIKSFIKYPKLRTNTNNGLTLCVNCHRNIHKKRSPKFL